LKNLRKYKARCTLCGGKGRHYERECPACHGIGVCELITESDPVLTEIFQLPEYGEARGKRIIWERPMKKNL